MTEAELQAKLDRKQIIIDDLREELEALKHKSSDHGDGDGDELVNGHDVHWWAKQAKENLSNVIEMEAQVKRLKEERKDLNHTIEDLELRHLKTLRELEGALNYVKTSNLARNAMVMTVISIVEHLESAPICASEVETALDVAREFLADNHVTKLHVVTESDLNDSDGPADTNEIQHVPTGGSDMRFSKGQIVNLKNPGPAYRAEVMEEDRGQKFILVQPILIPLPLPRTMDRDKLIA